MWQLSYLRHVVQPRGRAPKRFNAMTPAIMAACLVLAACQGSTATAPHSASKAADRPASMISNAPVVQSAAGLSLPLEQYLVKTSESHVINFAHAVLTKKCMARFGFAYAIPSATSTLEQDSDSANMSRRYGLSDAQAAATLGYEVPPAPAAQQTTVNEVLSFSDAEYEVLWGHTKAANTAAVSALPDGTTIPKGGCVGEAARAFVGHGSLDGSTLAQQLDTQSFFQSQNDPQVVAVIGAWSRCMAGKGYSFKTPFDAMAAFAGSSAPSSAEIQQALTDISCKKQTSLLTKWDSVESKIQDALIAKNQLALTNGLKAEQELVKYAESVIS